MKEQEKIPAKERILISALNLFAQKGYDGVGVDQIAEEAGLKGPSIYRHYKSKEEILNSIIERVDARYEEGIGRLKQMPIPESLEELKKMSLRQILFTINDEQIIKVRKIMTIEQYRNTKLADLATRHFVREMQQRYAVAFKGMMENGVIPQSDAESLAFAYTSPISALIACCDRDPERKDEYIQDVEKFIDFFVAEIADKH